MQRIWFKISLGIFMVTALGVAVFHSSGRAVAYTGASNQTGVIITVTYIEPINVRSGPNTVDYPIVGRLNVGETAPALGVSTKREWVQIAYPASPTGTGWVYAAYVTVSGGELQVVESPPTPTAVIVTIDPTLAAAFNIQPTQTRLPTFTPPPPLTVPSFDDGRAAPRGVFGFFILGLGLIGAVGLIVSFVLRK